MANFACISAAGLSLERYLNRAFEEAQPVENSITRAVFVRATDLAPAHVGNVLPPPALSIYLYWVNVNRTMRSAWAAVGSQDGRAHLPLDLHFLLSAWADNAEHEHCVLGRAIQALEEVPTLSGPFLHPSGGWAANESLQVVLEDVSEERVMRVFDLLPTDYRLSVPYVARITRVDSSVPAPGPRVLTLATGLVPEATP